jgi:hypothetical protein
MYHKISEYYIFIQKKAKEKYKMHQLNILAVNKNSPETSAFLSGQFYPEY